MRRDIIPISISCAFSAGGAVPEPAERKSIIAAGFESLGFLSSMVKCSGSRFFETGGAPNVFTA